MCRGQFGPFPAGIVHVNRAGALGQWARRVHGQRDRAEQWGVMREMREHEFRRIGDRLG